MIEFVPMWDVDSHWKEIGLHLSKAIARQSAMNLESVYRDCKGGKFHLWRIAGKAALVTEIQQFPCERICMIVLAGGEGAEDWLDDTDETLTRYAKSFNCNAMMIVGRRGWSRIHPDYHIEDVVMRKKL